MDVNLEMDPKLLLKKYEQDINVSAEGCFFRVLLVSRDLKGRSEDHFRGSLPRSALFFNLPMLIIKEFGVDSKERGFCSVIVSLRFRGFRWHVQMQLVRHIKLHGGSRLAYARTQKIREI